MNCFLVYMSVAMAGVTELADAAVGYRTAEATDVNPHLHDCFQLSGGMT